MKNNNINSQKFVTLSFDIEDWFQVESFKNKFSIEDWESQELRIEIGTEKILNLLEKYNIKATFFILGWIAERKPELVKKIYIKGHEIASHGYNHQLNYNMTREELFEDFKDSKKLLENIINDDILGYRAPTFSVSDDVIELLGELNYKYDSSYNQFSKHDRYGILTNKEQEPVFNASRQIVEISIPATTILKQEIPIAGGGFFRLYPLWITKRLVDKYFMTENYYMFYAHPWEFDDNMPRVKDVEPLNKFRHYINVNKNYKKLDSLIKYFKSKDYVFLTAKEYLNKENSGEN